MLKKFKSRPMISFDMKTTVNIKHNLKVPEGSRLKNFFVQEQLN